jgi:hypothetical protein
MADVAENPAPPGLQLSAEERSKDDFFVRIAQLGEAMIAAHGKEFAMGALILSARFIAEGRPLIKRRSEAAARPEGAATPP